MFVEMILSIISVALILILLLVRKFNFVYAKGESKVLSSSDRKIVSFWNWLKRIYRESSDDVVELVKDTPHITLHFLNRIFYKLYKRTKKLINLIKGKRIRSDGGSVSLYLKRIEKKD